jgi:hypothetical protein
MLSDIESVSVFVNYNYDNIHKITPKLKQPAQE